MRNSKQLLSIFIDFIFLISFALCLCLIFLFGKYVLYRDFDKGGELYILTESTNKEYINDLSVGDTLFDTLTKRKIGTADHVKAISSEESVQFIISVKANYTPKSKALRTERLWFKYEIIEKEEFESLAEVE